VKHRRASWLVVPILLACRLAGADDAPPGLHGGWVATVGTVPFRGRWTAEALPGDAGAVRGTFTLIDAHDETVGGGTWSGRQQGRRWRGGWSARTADGHLFTGTWAADTRGGGSFADMLAASASAQITGTWRMRGARGHWWLKG
jgi:hypothetical protein